MSQWIAIVKGEGREEYIEKGIRLTKAKESAMRYDTGMEAKLAAEALTRAVIGDEPRGYPRLYPWITDVDAEEVE